MIKLNQKYTLRTAALISIVSGIFVFLNFSAPAKADTVPEIDYAPSIVQNGQSVTINGSGFGSKATPDPLRYDDFETGIVGERLLDQDSGGWYTEVRNGIFPRYSTARQRIPGEQVIEQRYRPALASNQTIGLWQLPPFRKFYASMWVYRDDFEGTAMQSINWKAWGNFGGSDPVHWYGYPQCRVDAYPINGSGHLYALNSTGQITGLPQQWFDSGAQLTSEIGRWIRIERYIDAGTVGNTDFTSWVSTDLDRWAEISGGPLYRDDGLMLDGFIFGQYFDVDPPSVASLNQYVGEMYCDTTQARIEIGDTSTWNTNTHREIQIPHITWVDGQIQFTVNQGSFGHGSTAYVYVVDSNGAVNTNGYQITFGGVSTPPVAAFTGTPLSGSTPLMVSFTDQSLNTPTSWSWTFGDAGTSTSRNPSHTYTNPGTYSVSLTATNADGSDIETKTGYVTVSSPSNNPPVLTSIGNKSLHEQETLTFNVLASDDDPEDTLTLSASNLPTGATFTDHHDHTGTFSWTPTSNQSNVYSNVHFEVTDGTDTDSENITITVLDGIASCTPAWRCSNWSVCADSLQTRSCDDDNNCGSDAGRPVETAPCDSTAPGIVSDLR